MKAKLENKDGKVENLPGLSLEDGTCIFPFVHNEKEYNECYKGQRGDWCATKISKKTKKIKKWAYCDPPKVTKSLRIFRPDMIDSNLQLYKNQKA